MADDSAVSKFVSVTGADANTAGFYLSSTNGDVDAAVSAFFESGGATVPEITPAGPAGGDEVLASAAEGGASDPSAPGLEPRVGSSSAGRAGGSRSVGGIATLASLGGNGGDDDDDESGKNYYAGGEKSGQMIQDPRGRGDGPSGNNGEGGEGGDLTEAIFERARQRGPLTEDEQNEFRGQQTFTGAGYRLGDAASAAVPTQQPDVVGRRNVTRTLTFYSDGFTIDDGPLRRLDDPANAYFLKDIERGYVPKEMEEPGVGNVSINLVDKKGEQYVPPKPTLVPFSGGGTRLGSSSTTPLAPETSGPPDATAANATVSVDEAQPVASIQVRLSDGSRLTARLNEHHTVQNLREMVQAARPGVPSFTLATTFPRTVLSDGAQTIKDAKLNGAVVVQSLS